MSATGNHPFGLPEHAITALRDVFRQWSAIERVVLYGSRAKGNYRNGSDIDLCVEGETLDLGDLLRMETQIDDLLLPWKVDLSLRDQIDNTELLAHIDRVGVSFHERS